MDGFASGIQVDPQTPPSPSISQPPKPGSGLIIGPQGTQQVFTNCCDKALVPTILNAYIEVDQGPFTCITDKYSLFYLASFNEWDAYETAEKCANTKLWLSLACLWPKNTWRLFVDIIADKRRRIRPTMTLQQQNCNNFKLVFTGTIFMVFPITVTIQLPSAPSPLPA